MLVGGALRWGWIFVDVMVESGEGKMILLKQQPGVS
jgi:hypothetical protein